MWSRDLGSTLMQYGREVGREALEAVVQMLEAEHFLDTRASISIAGAPGGASAASAWFAASNLGQAGASGVEWPTPAHGTHAER